MITTNICGEKTLPISLFASYSFKINFLFSWLAGRNSMRKKGNKLGNQKVRRYRKKRKRAITTRIEKNAPKLKVKINYIQQERSSLASNQWVGYEQSLFFLVYRAKRARHANDHGVTEGARESLPPDPCPRLHFPH